jgi:hypothetical protein
LFPHRHENDDDKQDRQIRLPKGCGLPVKEEESDLDIWNLVGNSRESIRHEYATDKRPL